MQHGNDLSPVYSLMTKLRTPPQCLYYRCNEHHHYPCHCPNSPELQPTSHPPNTALTTLPFPIRSPQPCLLPPTPIQSPASDYMWGEYDSIIHEASEVAHWRRNTFPVPYGNVGKASVSKLCHLLRAYADGSALKAISLKAYFAMSVLLPFPHQKDHVAWLVRRLPMCTAGNGRVFLCGQFC